MTDGLKNWVMIVLTLLFITLYALAIIGWLKPLTDFTVAARLEPIIFVIIGYYFGRLPAQQTERTLKDEIGRQTQKADAAQHVKEQTQQEREKLEERIKNTKVTLLSNSGTEPDQSLKEAARNNLINPKETVYSSSIIATAIKILDS